MIDGFQRLCELIGQNDAFKLMNLCGGTRVYIPLVEHCKPEHYLAQVIGLDNLVKLAQEFACDRIEVPMGYHAFKEQRNKEIIRQFNEGICQSELAISFGLTERQIRTIVAKRPPVVDKSQMSLFS